MWRECHETQLRLFPDAEVDVFFHFWDTVEPVEKQAIYEALKPRDSIFEAPRDYSFVNRYPEIQPDNINVPSRLMSQYMSWRKVATLFQPYAPRYDLAVRSRSDLYFFDRIRYDLENVVKGGITAVSYQWPEHPIYVSDMFVVGKPRAIVHCLSLIDAVWDYTPHGPFNPEMLFTHHILAMPAIRGSTAQFVLSELPFFVFRPHMAGWSPERCRLEGPGISKWRDPEVIAAHQQYHAARYGDAGIEKVEQFAQAQLARVTTDPEA